MVEIRIEKGEHRSEQGPPIFPRLSSVEIEVLVYALKKLTRGWSLQKGQSNER